MTQPILARHPQLIGKPRAMAMFCALLRDRGLHADALALGEAAIDAAPGDMAVRDTVRVALSRGVEPFHRPMLLDRLRNAAYRRAIEQAVTPGMLVLEIGAGAGLLAMIAARAGAEVITCEENPAIAAAAAAIVERNGLAKRVRVIPKRSDALCVGVDLPRRADLVVHEIFGSQLIDEGVTAALSDARARLLTPGAPSVPPRASLRCRLVAAPDAGRPDALADVEGFDLSLFELLVRPMRALRPGSRLMPRSAPASLLAMDYGAAPPFGPAESRVTLASQGGRVDGIAQWLAIEFADGTELESDPFRDGPASSWVGCYHPLPRLIETAPGEAVEVTARHRGILLTLDAARGEGRAGG